MPIRSLALAFACAFCVARTATAADGSPPADDVGSLVARFDRAVAGGLPASLALPGEPRRRTSRGAPESLVIERDLRVDLSMPGDVPAAMYLGTLGGRSAIFTRGGERLEISLPESEAVEVVGYVAGRQRVERQSFSAHSDPVDSVDTLPPPREGIGPGHIEDPSAFRPTFHVFVHDDLRTRDVYRLHARFVAWWIADLLQILPAEPSMAVTYHTRIPWITDMDYQHADVLDRFSNALALFADATGLPYERTYKHKFLLLTASSPVKGAAGLAFEGQSEAVASVSGPLSVVAHEFGHLLGASHDAAATLSVLATLWHPALWVSCDTTMHPTAPSLVGCLWYSAENQRRIRSYQKHGPAPSPGQWLDR
jgi:hypothetical protein